jgi:hypothetical protein
MDAAITRVNRRKVGKRPTIPEKAGKFRAD